LKYKLNLMKNIVTVKRKKDFKSIQKIDFSLSYLLLFLSSSWCSFGIRYIQPPPEGQCNVQGKNGHFKFPIMGMSDRLQGTIFLVTGKRAFQGAELIHKTEREKKRGRERVGGIVWRRRSMMKKKSDVLWWCGDMMAIMISRGFNFDKKANHDELRVKGEFFLSWNYRTRIKPIAHKFNELVQKVQSN